MTIRLEEEFNLPPTDIGERAVETNAEESETIPEALEQEATDLKNALSNLEKIDYALSVIPDLTEQHEEMDDIAEKALEAYRDILMLGMNAPIGNASRLLEVANMMLKTALDAKTSKASQKMKIVELQLRKAKVEADGGTPNDGPGFGHKEMTELLKDAAMTLVDHSANASSSDEKESDGNK